MLTTPLEQARSRLAAAASELNRSHQEKIRYEASYTDASVLATARESWVYWKGYHTACVRAVQDLEESTHGT